MSPIYIEGVEQVVAHKTRHQDGGADEVSVAALSGELADRQPSKAGSSVLGWTDKKLLKGAGVGVAPTEIDVPVSLVVLKTADESVTSSTVLQNDDHLLFAVGANEVWEFLIFLRLVAGNITPDFKYAFTVPTGGSIVISGQVHIGAQAVEVDGTTAQIAIALSATQGNMFFLGLYIGGANAGNVQLQWAQNTSDAAATTVKTNSFIIAHKLN